MTADRSTPPTSTSQDTVDPARLAAAARSILACPAGATLVVDGVEDVLAGMDELGMQDLGGEPTFTCLSDTPLAAAARGRRSALLTLESGLGPLGSADRLETLTLSGRLVSRGREDCACCRETRDIVALELNFVLLGRMGDDDQHFRVPLEQFSSPEHHLNRGFLQRSAEHANASHQEELRRAVSSTTGTRLSEVVGVALTGLLPDQVEVRWVDVDGAHSQVLAFSRTARSTEELGELLRRELHAGLC